MVAYPECSPADRAWLDGVRSTYDPEGHALLPPHFTLVFPTEGIAAAIVTRHTGAVAASMLAFSFTLRYAIPVQDAVSGRWNAFLVPEEGHAAITLLHDALYAGPLARHLRTGIPFVPHMTVAASDDGRTCELLANRLRDDGIAVRGIVRFLSVASFDRSSVTTVATVPLKSLQV